MSDDFRSLDGLLTALWSRLDRAAQDGDGPAHTLALATARPGGGAAVRMLILRGAERDAGELTLWTNTASGKVGEIADDPVGEILIWDADAGFQARLGVTLTARPGPEAVWSSLGTGARQNYARDPAPADPVEAPEAETPTPSREMFTTLSARIDRLDLLHLNDVPHARAQFFREDGFEGRWVAP